jgi:hypothetical protein
LPSDEEPAGAAEADPWERGFEEPAAVDEETDEDAAASLEDTAEEPAVTVDGEQPARRRFRRR